MPYMIAVSLEMSDEPKKLPYPHTIHANYRIFAKKICRL